MLRSWPRSTSLATAAGCSRSCRRWPPSPRRPASPARRSTCRCDTAACCDFRRCFALHLLTCCPVMQSPAALKIMQTLVTENMALFPSELGLYHLGADEVQYNADCGLTKATYHAFINAMNAFVRSKNKTMIVWEVCDRCSCCCLCCCSLAAAPADAPVDAPADAPAEAPADAPADAAPPRASTRTRPTRR